MGYGVDFYLYASVLDVKRCADCCDGTVTRFSTCGARLRGYSCFRLPHFGSVLNCQYRSIQVQVSIFQLSTIAALYKKKAQGCAEGRGLVPLCGFLTFQCDLPSAGFRSPCGIQQVAAIYTVIRPEFRNPCGIYGRDSAIHAAIRPGPPQHMRLLFPHTKFRKYLINKVFPK